MSPLTLTVGLKPDLKKYCNFEHDGTVYQFQTCPFGLNVLPKAYTKVMSILYDRWRAKGYRCLGYIDDGLWAADSFEKAQEMLHDVLGELEKAGFVINRAKANLQPAQAVKFLGHIVDTSGPTVRLFVPDHKLQSIRSRARQLLESFTSGRRWVKGRALASVVGMVIATKFAFTAARLMTREMLGCLRQLPLKKEGGHAVRDYDQDVELTKSAAAELQFLAERMHECNGAEWCELTPTRKLYTDGSSTGTGALLTRVLNGVERDTVDWRQGEYEPTMPEKDRQSTRTELEATYKALEELDTVEGQSVLHQTDSMATYYGLTNGGYSVEVNSELK